MNIAIFTDFGRHNMAEILELEDKTFTKEVKLSEKPIVLVDFYATWCGPCQLQHPILEEIAAEFDYVKVCRIDVDKAPKIAARYGIISVPTLMVFSQGQIVNIEIGLQDKETLRNMVM